MMMIIEKLKKKLFIILLFENNDKENVFHIDSIEKCNTNLRINKKNECLSF